MISQCVNDAEILLAMPHEVELVVSLWEIKQRILMFTANLLCGRH